MVAPNDILARRNEIKDCLATAQLEKAIKRMIDFVRDFHEEAEDEIVLLSMDYYDLRQDIKLGVVKREDARLDKRQLVNRLLMSLKDIFERIQIQQAA